MIGSLHLQKVVPRFWHGNGIPSKRWIGVPKWPMREWSCPHLRFEKNIVHGQPSSISIHLYLFMYGCMDERMYVACMPVWSINPRQSTGGTASDLVSKVDLIWARSNPHPACQSQMKVHKDSLLKNVMSSWWWQASWVGGVDRSDNID